MKLSNRLKLVEQMIDAHYTHIWDCCCDHGHLGAALLSKHPETVIHFVDIVPELISTLDSKLKRFCAESKWETHCLDVSHLPLQQYHGKHLVIIAGVGGDLTAEFVEAIHKSHPTLNIDFVLCPVHHHFDLRQKLIELKFGLKEEALIKDNQRFYEVIFVSTDKEDTHELNSVGNRMWCAKSDKEYQVATEYLRQTLSHYQRIQQGNKMDVQPILDAYQKVKTLLTK